MLGPSRPGPPFPSRLEESFAYHLAHATWAPGTLRDLHLDLDAERDCPTRVRHATRDLLDGHVGDDTLHDALLTITELVNNAVLHTPRDASHTVQVHVALGLERIRMEVCDQGSGFDPRDADLHTAEIGGLGLIVVDRIARRWGTSCDAGHCVWLEMDV